MSKTKTRKAKCNTITIGSLVSADFGNGSKLEARLEGFRFFSTDDNTASWLELDLSHVRIVAERHKRKAK